ncbi:substrate-binding domain-containing protein [Epibacterium ulvae]|uniref:phosphate ABC transporter substrate-binding/OmpA family protein n=1 Tax=Epibacterium ulvae TaxID=1156985 RepID=UPI001BFC6D12|nr:phosphate ABC transporter substrate-binding/OmpA family protein [Epibacterium ulvae]MBT8153548.1 substrate-binding domain-containing protein [Epibacterium ulvae]
MVNFRAVVSAALLLLCGLQPVAAQDVTLSSPDGAVEITGNLLGFDGEFYRVDTKFGELTVDGSGVSCEGPGCPSLSDFVAEITLSGSAAMAEILLPALIEGYALRNGYQTHRNKLSGQDFEYLLRKAGGGTAARFVFAVSDTDQGFADLLDDAADIVMAQREVRDTELSAARSLGLGDLTQPARSRVLALDALVPIVAPDNPVQNIDLPSLIAVLRGEIDNWSVLGGPDAPISTHVPLEGVGVAQLIEDEFDLTGLPSRAQQHERLDALARYVAIDPFALGLGLYSQIGTARALQLGGNCGFGLEVGRQAVKTEDYPITAPLFLYLPARRLPKIGREFLSYVRGPAAQIVIRRAGFVDQAPERIALNRQGNRLANAISSAGDEVGLSELARLVDGVKEMDRLTTTFRFETGSARPDAQSRGNIEQLARDLEAGVYDGRKLMFVGFSDGEGPAAANRDIALKRATAVRDAVIETSETANLSLVNLSVEAFGEAMPMACDDSAWGRKVNRRVEIWVR